MFDRTTVIDIMTTIQCETAVIGTQAVQVTHRLIFTVLPNGSRFTLKTIILVGGIKWLTEK